MANGNGFFDTACHDVTPRPRRSRPVLSSSKSGAGSRKHDAKQPKANRSSKPARDRLEACSALLTTYGTCPEAHRDLPYLAQGGIPGIELGFQDRLAYAPKG